MDINLGRNTVKLTRKAHRKVRTGCSICKSRKIKVSLSPLWDDHSAELPQCDEQKPQCGRCKKYGAECDIVEAQHAHASQTMLGPGWRAVHLDAGAPAALGMHDLELMFHWDSSTHATLSPNPAMQHFFRRNVVSMALRCEFVALSLLSLAALHLAHETPARAAELTDRALHYQSIASRKAIDLLPIPEGPGSEELIENLFAFSSLTIFHGESEVVPSPYMEAPDACQSSPARRTRTSCFSATPFPRIRQTGLAYSSARLILRSPHHPSRTTQVRCTPS
jgi:hypothetical protein